MGQQGRPVAKADGVDGADDRGASDGRPATASSDQALETSIRSLLDGRSGTICPSEAARAVGGEQWRDLMEAARRAARRLVAAGEVEVTQGGRVVDPATATGPIRIRRVPGPPH